jgi:hypothetical protein
MALIPPATKGDYFHIYDFRIAATRSPICSVAHEIR